MIGRVFETQEDLLIRGVKRDLRATRPDYIVLMPAPGIGGPEIFNLGTIPRGRRFRITGVIDRKNSLFSKPQYVVEFSGAPITNESVESIQLYNVQAFPLYLLPVADGAAPPLNPKYLLEVNALPDPPK